MPLKSSVIPFTSCLQVFFPHKCLQKQKKQYLCAPNVRWCNGSTADFGSACQGSNPCRTTIERNDSEGTTVPSFYNMIKKEKIAELANQFLEGTDRFLVEVNTNAENRILVFIDSDTSVTIDHCIALSRHIESHFDREAEDFELNVSSSGVGQPFTQLRQFRKYEGLAVQIKLNDGRQIKGILKSADESRIELFEEAKNKNKKSKRIMPGDLIILPMDTVSETKGIVNF